jgi:hypothetical protein
MYHITYFLYMHAAALLAPMVLSEVFEHFGEILNRQKKVYPLLAMLRTTTFAAKVFFLVFMHPLVWHISRVNKWYYWFVFGFYVASWMFVIVDPFIICPYFGADASESFFTPFDLLKETPAQLHTVQCFDSTVDKHMTLGLAALVTVLNILSDLLSMSCSTSP